MIETPSMLRRIRFAMAAVLLAPLVFARPAASQCLTGPHAWEPPPEHFDAMIVAAHPDDELVPFRGLLPRLASEGKTVLVIVVADDENQTRREATRNAIWTTGLRHEPIFLGLSNPCFGKSLDCVLLEWGGLHGVVGAIESLIETYRPAVLYTHDAIEGENDHPQHRATSIAAVVASHAASHRPETIVVHRWPRSTFVNTWSQDEMATANAALSCHFGTIPTGNDPTFEPDQGFDYGRWMAPASEDFGGLPDGSDPPGWSESGANGSLLWADAFEVFASTYRTKTTDGNVHSHLLLAPRSHYEYTGRMRVDDEDTGVGVTFHSGFPNADRYYRLRRGPFLGGTFQLSPHGTATSSGTTDTGVLPVAGTWYRFRIMVATESTETALRAKVWPDGEPEPGEWPVEAVDASGTRLTAGVVGVWAMNGGASWDNLAITPLCDSSANCIGAESCLGGVCVAPPATVPIPSLDWRPLAVLAALLGIVGAASLRLRLGGVGGFGAN